MPKFGLMEIILFDKIIHFTFYALFTWLLLHGAWKGNPGTNRKKSILTILLISVLFGIGLEVIQGQVYVKRDFEILDIIANIIGSFAGMTIFILFVKRQNNDWN
jgi:VanZ family protein